MLDRILIPFATWSLQLITVVLVGLSPATEAQTSDEIDLLEIAESAEWSAHFPEAHLFTIPMAGKIYGPLSGPLHFEDQERKYSFTDVPDGAVAASKTNYEAWGPSRTTGVQCGDHVSHSGVTFGPPVHYEPRGSDRPRPYVQAIWSEVTIPFDGIVEWDGCLWGAGISHEKCDGVGVRIGVRKSNSDEEWSDFPGELVHAGRHTGAEGGSVKSLKNWYGETVDIRVVVDDHGQSWADWFVLDTLRIRRASEYVKLCVDRGLLVPAFEKAFNGLAIVMSGDTVSVKFPGQAPETFSLPGGIFIGGTAVVDGEVVVVEHEITLKDGYPSVSTTERYDGGFRIDFEFTEGPLSIEGWVTGRSIRPAFTVFVTPYAREGMLFFAWGYEVRGDIDIAYLPDGPAETKFRDQFEVFLGDKISPVLDQSLLPGMRAELDPLLTLADAGPLRSIIVHHDEICLMTEKHDNDPEVTDGIVGPELMSSSFLASLGHERAVTLDPTQGEDEQVLLAFVRYHDGLAAATELTVRAPDFDAAGGEIFFLDAPQLLGEMVVSYDRKLVIRAPQGTEPGTYLARTELRLSTGELVDYRSLCLMVTPCPDCDCSDLLESPGY